MQNNLCDDRPRASGFRNRSGFTLLAVVMLSLGVGATTAVFALVDWTMPRSALSTPCETVMDDGAGVSNFALAKAPSGEELRDRVSDAYRTSVESAGDAIGDIPDLADGVGPRPVLALLGVAALAFLVACTRAASGMISRVRAPLVAIGTLGGALVVAALSLRALGLAGLGFRAIAVALCVSMLTVYFARAMERKGAPVTAKGPTPLAM